MSFLLFLVLVPRRVRQACVFTVRGLRWRKRSLRVGSAGCGIGEEKMKRNLKRSRLEVGC